METGKRIQILLSTFNGEKYLREQLDSYLTLTGDLEIRVFIRDDGSTDQTVKILREYEQTYGFTVLCGENVGVNRSIWTLLEESADDCDFFAISDQDDVWMPDKLVKAVGALQSRNMDKPLLFGSLSQIVDYKLTPLGSTLVPRKEVRYFNAMVQNVIPGHTQVFNRALRDILLMRGAQNIHVVDWWLYLAASATGEVIFLPEFTVLHRQHGKNSVGYQTTWIKKLVNRLKNLKSGKANAISIQLADFYRRYQSDMRPEYRKETQRYFACMSGIGKRLAYAVTCRAYRQSLPESLLFRVLYVLKKYNYQMKQENV